MEPLAGNWFRLNSSDREDDLLVREEIIKERVRQLFNRYGLLFRELVTNELSPMKWSRIFRTLRLMELSGEILTGHFFKGIPGLQFISFEAFNYLKNENFENMIFWINAADPASLCGIKLEGLKKILPARRATTFIIFHGPEPVLVLKRSGKTLEFSTEPDNQHMDKYFMIFKSLMNRDFNPMNHISIETINGEPAYKSEYAAPLKKFGFVVSYRYLELRKKYG